MKTMFAFVPLFVLAAGCSAPETEDHSKLSMKAEIVVTSDPGHGLGGAVLVASDRPVATTNAEGHASVDLEGVEGDSVALTVRCPAGFESPAPVRVALRRLSKDSRPPRFDARCAPLERTFVVGIRADNGPDLPIYRLGKLVGRTDAAGAAHVVVRAKANEQISLTLDTKGVERPSRLRPESPTLTFVAGPRDEVVVLEQRFDLERAAAVRRAPPRPAPTPLPAPTRI
ncbi:MAG: hypothetical protein KF795_07195 [Labilithrix sp.]|nr:hypothetical protein [Labilithrix sp.]